MSQDQNSTRLAEITADIVSAYVAKNAVQRTELADVIASVHRSLSAISDRPVVEPLPPQIPAVPIRKSVTPDYLVCLEDGKKFKSLRRHLGTHHNMTPDEYRAKWGLPHDYPMAAPSYSAARSVLAKTIGLGRKAKALEPEPAPIKRGRRKAAASV